MKDYVEVSKGVWKPAPWSRAKPSKYQPGERLGTRVILQANVSRCAGKEKTRHYLLRCDCGKEQWVKRHRLDSMTPSSCLVCFNRRPRNSS